VRRSRQNQKLCSISQPTLITLLAAKSKKHIKFKTFLILSSNPVYPGALLLFKAIANSSRPQHFVIDDINNIVSDVYARKTNFSLS